MNVTELKEKLLTSLDLWADARISDMVKENPALAIPSVYMKRASHNIIANNKDKWGKIYCNYLECKSPECLYTEDVVVIILVESEYVSNSIINQLKKYNIGKYITYSEISEKR